MNKLGILGILGATAALLTVPVLGISYAAAQGGADDPAGHVRHSGTDDAATHDAGDDHGGTHHRVRGTADRIVLAKAKANVRADDHGRRHGGHGADDPAGHVRHSGDDDAPGHVRHSGDDDPAGHVRHSGDDDPAGHDAGDDHGGRHGGHGGDDHGGDDHGGHGGDDD